MAILTLLFLTNLGRRLRNAKVAHERAFKPKSYIRLDGGK